MIAIAGRPIGRKLPREMPDRGCESTKMRTEIIDDQGQRVLSLRGGENRGPIRVQLLDGNFRLNFSTHYRLYPIYPTNFSKAGPGPRLSPESWPTASIPVFAASTAITRLPFSTLLGRCKRSHDHLVRPDLV